MHFTPDIKRPLASSEVVFITVGTPQNEDGSADLQFIYNAVEEISTYINSYKVIVIKSTVPIGTGRKIRQQITQSLVTNGRKVEFDVISNPEFLREGNAVYDFM